MRSGGRQRRRQLPPQRVTPHLSRCHRVSSRPGRAGGAERGRRQCIGAGARNGIIHITSAKPPGHWLWAFSVTRAALACPVAREASAHAPHARRHRARSRAHRSGWRRPGRHPPAADCAQCASGFPPAEQVNQCVQGRQGCDRRPRFERMHTQRPKQDRQRSTGQQPQNTACHQTANVPVRIRSSGADSRPDAR